eukprot:TRINITY_DN2720_c0_g1_i3.p1 TRINITY_DN2720_c0_g1~~TRINITY_DN2720_c0_g1_i3.p1  ORF type:complete len:112 (-),score=21.33 TRINITY_DN2720_c0_g1_i3:4-339(-)
MCIRDRYMGRDSEHFKWLINQITPKQQEDLKLLMQYRRITIAETNSTAPRRIVKARHFSSNPVSYTHLRAHETSLHLVCRLLLEKKKKTLNNISTNKTNIIYPSTKHPVTQ